MTALYFISISIFLILSLVLCIVILMQEGKSTGLGASFGGDPTQSVFGTSTADVLKTFTGWLAVIFFTLCVLLSLWTATLERTRGAITPIDIEQID